MTPISTSCSNSVQRVFASGPNCDPQRGSALLWALGLMSAMVALVFSDIDVMRAGAQEKAVEFAENGEAASVADAGLNDAFAWLRRQSVQPVTVFAPRRDLTAIPPINETDDASVGLVREYEISPGIWGRYEVRKGRAMDPFVDSNANGRYDAGESFTDLARPVGAAVPLTGGFVAGRTGDGYADGEWTPARWTRDVSTARGWAAQGTVWRVESRGMVFRRERADLPLGRDPNVLLGSVTKTSEVRRLVMTPPSTASICATSPGSVTLGARVRVRALGGLAVGVKTATGSVTKSTGADVQATTLAAVVPGYDASVKKTFGVEWAELKAMADVSSKSLSGIPDTIQDGNLVVLERDVTYDADLPLTGSGVLVVKGNLTLAADSKSYFTGVLYVEGNVTIYAPALVRGTIIATGTVKLEGSSGDYVELEHDPASVTKILGSMSQYRFARAAYTPDRRLLDTALVLSDPWSAVPDPVVVVPPVVVPPVGGGGSTPPPVVAPPAPAPAPYVPPPTYGDTNEDNNRPPRRRDRKSNKGHGH